MLPYQVALQSMDKGTNWGMCCQMAIDEIANLEITTYFGFQTIRVFNNLSKTLAHSKFKSLHKMVSWL
jgi:hypothetical protein